MAENKKSFVLYSDQRGTFEKLSNEQAGLLIKHIYAYVNDENPNGDFITELAFEPIKTQLKRDLVKWESLKEKRSLAGKKSAEVKANNTKQILTNSTCVESVEQSSTNSTVNVNVNDNVNVNVIKEKKEVFNFRKELIALGVKDNIAIDFLKVRKTKRATNTETAFKLIKKQIETSNMSANECIIMAVENSWQTFKNEWAQKKQIIQPGVMRETDF